MTKACCTDALSEQSIDYSEKQAAATKQYVGVVKKKTKAVQSGDGLSQQQHQQHRQQQQRHQQQT